MGTGGRAVLANRLVSFIDNDGTTVFGAGSKCFTFSLRADRGVASRTLLSNTSGCCVDARVNSDSCACDVMEGGVLGNDRRGLTDGSMGTCAMDTSGGCICACAVNSAFVGYVGIGSLGDFGVPVTSVFTGRIERGTMGGQIVFSLSIGCGVSRVLLYCCAVPGRARGPDISVPRGSASARASSRRV